MSETIIAALIIAGALLICSRGTTTVVGPQQAKQAGHSTFPIPDSAKSERPYVIGFETADASVRILCVPRLNGSPEWVFYQYKSGQFEEIKNLAARMVVHEDPEDAEAIKVRDEIARRNRPAVY